MKKREDIPVEYTWDLTHLYPTRSEWEKDLQEIGALLEKIVQRKGEITKSSTILLDTLTILDQINLKLEWATSYARMAFDVDMGNPQAKKDYETIYNLNSNVNDQLAFIEPELLTVSPETFKRYKLEKPELATYAFLFEKLYKQKEHILRPEEEEILARMESLGGSFEKIYDDITVNDLQFPEIEDEKGEKIIANEVNYRKNLTSYDRETRKKFFKGLLSTYGSHINSISSTFYGSVKYRAYLAKTRKYSSSRHMAVSRNHIPIEVYDTLINTVRSNVGLLQDYIKLRKKILGYEEIHFYDLFVPLVEDINKIYSLEEAREIVLEALGVLGETYISDLKQAFQERWLDYYPNKGKSPGAYANGVYGVHPYSLLNFTGTLEDIFTMAHELGHVMHSYYSNKHQPYINSDYTIFTAEVASTVNEYFLFRYLLHKAASSKEKAHLLSMHLDSIRSTLYRQAFFADFEMQVHQMAEKDQPLTPDTLCSLYRQLYEYYHGPGFVIDEELTYEWARIPHFYNAFYVYQYATGISAAISLARNILEQKPRALEAYLDFLKAGGSDYPINILKKAGIDMSTSAPILAALQDFSDTLQRLAQLF